MSCPTNETLERLALDFLENAEAVRAHVSKCASCAERVRALAQGHGVLTRAAKKITLPRLSTPHPTNLPWRPFAVAAGLAAVLLGGWIVFRIQQRPLLPPEPRSREVVPAHPGDRGLNRPSPCSSASRISDSLTTERPFPSGSEEEPFNTEAYDRIVDNGFLAASQNPLSTFSIDVDTASYANVRRFLNQGMLPPKDAVRIEELINYFSYEYPNPEPGRPFSVTTEVSSCPWSPKHHLVRIGLQTAKIEIENLPPRNLVFLIDVSGSMQPANKLPLLKKAMGLLVDTLSEKDRVAMVVYAGSSGLVLPSTPGSDKEKILEALSALEAGGSTNGGSGIQLAYKVAQENLVKGGVNRVILATDGDFNVGVTHQGDLTRLIEEKRESGVFLTVLGFGMGNLKDSTMEKLADKGNGNYAYIDTLHEARKVLVKEAGGTLVTVAKDVKIQVEFNPGNVTAYRLIGYENRLLRAEDFHDDKKDAGEIGAGHSVTALYEIVPAGVEWSGSKVDPLRYQTPREGAAVGGDELMTVKLRYKEPTENESKLMAHVVKKGERRFDSASRDLQFSASVATFGMLLRDSEHKGSATWPMAIEIARGAVGDDPDGYRREFVNLAAAAARLREGDRH